MIQLFPVATPLSETRVAVAWWEEDGRDMVARFVEEDGPVGTRFSVATDVDARDLAICSLSSSLLLAWRGGPTEPRGSRIKYRIFDRQGEALTPINEATPEDSRGQPNQMATALTCLGEEQFVLMWTESRSVSGRLFGESNHSDFRVGFAPSRFPHRPALASLGLQEFIATWFDCAEDSAQCNLLGQRFALDGRSECPADCNGDGMVQVSELVLSTNIALSEDADQMKQCLAVDRNLDYRVSISELIAGVRQLLGDCSDAG